MKDNLQKVSRDYELMKVKYLQKQNNKRAFASGSNTNALFQHCLIAITLSA